MLKKVTICIDTDSARIPESDWDNRFVMEIITQELDTLSPYGYVQGYTIEDISKKIKD
jgi:hypothetical protein